jgi:cardiolipin synthase
MRSHRKILVLDGTLAFTGGMNIDETFLHGDGSGHKHRDLHFRVRGPVVADLQRVFIDDWEFTTGERLGGEVWLPPSARVGPTPARCVPDGPDELTDRILMCILGAISCARTSIAIATPYFLPDEPLLSALDVAALRGVEVDILLPETTNVKLVQWATTPFLERVMEGGCRVWASPPPFDHTKLMVVDHAWTFLGSANLDPRSLRLNFEVNLECYGKEVAEKAEWIFLDKKQKARQVRLEDLRRRSFPVRLRDNVARLFSPYL